MLGLFERKKAGAHSDAPSSSSASNSNSHDKELKGTQFKVGKTVVTVERKIAEGTITYYFTVLTELWLWHTYLNLQI